MKERLLELARETGREKQFLFGVHQDLTLQSQVAAGMKLVAEMGEIGRALDAVGLPCLFLKGAALSKLLFGNCYHRPSGDIDVLVDKVQLTEARSVLKNLGYCLRHPHFSSLVQEQSWLHYGKAETWGKAGYFDVDLHWRLTSQWAAFEPSFSELYRTKLNLEIAGLQISTLSHHYQIIFLSLHGAQDGWAHLKAVVELGLFLERYPVRIDELQRLSSVRWPLVEHGLDLCGKLGQRSLPVKDWFMNRQEAISFLRSTGRQTPSPSSTPTLSLLRFRYWDWRKPGLVLRQILRAVLTPSVEDISSISLPGLQAYPLWRMCRLVHKAFLRWIQPRFRPTEG